MIVHLVLLIIGAIVLVAVLIKLLYCSVFFLLHPHGIGVIAGLGAIVFLVLLAISAANHGGMQAVIHIFQPPKQNNAQRAAAEEANLRARIQKQLAEQSAASRTGQTPSMEKLQPEIAYAKHSDTASSRPPAWINEPPHREGDSYFVVLKLDADTSPAERDEWLDQRMLVAAKDYIDDRLFPGEDVAKVVKLSPQFLYDNCLREIYPASGMTAAGKEVYARLEFDRKFRGEVARRYRQIIEVDHVRSLARIALVGLLLLGGLYTYLRMSLHGRRLVDKTDPTADAEKANPGNAEKTSPAVTVN